MVAHTAWTSGWLERGEEPVTNPLEARLRKAVHALGDAPRTPPMSEPGVKLTKAEAELQDISTTRTRSRPVLAHDTIHAALTSFLAETPRAH